MRFSVLIHSQSWESVEAMLAYHYPSYSKSLAGFKRAFDTLLRMTPKHSDFVLTIKPFEGNDSNFMSACALFDNYDYRLMILPWDEVLGMSIDPKTLNNYTTPEITALILWEMTFLGFDEDTILARQKELLSDN